MDRRQMHGQMYGCMDGKTCIEYEYIDRRQMDSKQREDGWVQRRQLNEQTVDGLKIDEWIDRKWVDR